MVILMFVLLNTIWISASRVESGSSMLRNILYPYTSINIYLYLFQAIGLFRFLASGNGATWLVPSAMCPIGTCGSGPIAP